MKKLIIITFLAVNTLFISSKASELTLDDFLNYTILSSSKENNLDGLKSAINSYADVSAVDEEGKTPLHYAINHNNKKMVEFLINEEADINIKDNEGKTPLYYAINNNNKEMVGLLIANRAEVDEELLSIDGISEDIKDMLNIGCSFKMIKK